MPNTIKLNFINKSDDTDNSVVVIYGKNESSATNEKPVAWIVIKNCGRGDSHPFVYPMETFIAAADRYGNYTPQFEASPGDAYALVMANSGHELVSVGNSSDPATIEVRNYLKEGAIDANVYKDGKLFAKKNNIIPQQKAIFNFRPILFIGAASQAEQGEVLETGLISVLNTELGLTGIGSADIVMTGGGSGTTAKPFRFFLENIQPA